MAAHNFFFHTGSAIIPMDQIVDARYIGDIVIAVCKTCIRQEYRSPQNRSHIAYLGWPLMLITYEINFMLRRARIKSDTYNKHERQKKAELHLKILALLSLLKVHTPKWVKIRPMLSGCRRSYNQKIL